MIALKLITDLYSNVCSIAHKSGIIHATAFCYIFPSLCFCGSQKARNYLFPWIIVAWIVTVLVCLSIALALYHSLSQRGESNDYIQEKMLGTEEIRSAE